MKLERKSIPMSGVELKFEGDTRKFKGYASVFNGVDSYGDTILPGAYKNTLAKDGLPKMFFNHDSWQLPIGKWTSAVEDEKGLLVEGELTEGNPQADAVFAALKHGTVDGLSIGFRLASNDYEEDVETGHRTIKNISRLYEVSVVNFPADNAARISDVRAEDLEEIRTIRDFEDYLRDSGGFSKSVATTLVAKAKKLFDARRESETSEKAETEILKRLKAIEESIH